MTNNFNSENWETREQTGENYWRGILRISIVTIQMKELEHVHTYDANGYEYEVYGKIDGRAIRE